MSESLQSSSSARELSLEKSRADDGSEHRRSQTSAPAVPFERLQGRHSYWDGKRKGFAVAIFMSFMMLQVLFVANLSYIFGAVYRESTRVHNLQILYVDYDGGILGVSTLATYEEFQGVAFPTFVVSSATDYPTVDSLRRAVCKGDVWAALYVHEGASTRLANSLKGSSTSYNSSDTITYIYNEARYPTVQEGFIVPNLQELIAATTSTYYRLSNITTDGIPEGLSPSAIGTLLAPVTASSTNLKPTAQGTRVLLNTVGMVMPVIQQFFFLMAINGITASFGLLRNLSIKGNGVFRGLMSYSYTLVAALTTAGYVFAFREDWDVGGKQYILSVLTYWIYMHVNFLVLDIATAFIPMSFLPFFVLTYTILNVSSTIVPFELSPAFYRWGYALPGHETYSILIQIWSNGCSVRLHRALPILFSWEVIGLTGAYLGNSYRCNQAVKVMSTPASETAKDVHASPAQGQDTSRDKELLGPSYPLPLQGHI